MSIKVKALILSGLLTCATACQKPAYRQTTKPYFVYKQTEQCLDSLCKHSQQILQDSTYRYFASDTISISAYLPWMLPKFNNRNELKMKQMVPQKIVDTVQNRVYYASMHQYITTTKTITQPLYEDLKMVMDNSKYYTCNGQDIYIPVKYYGKSVHQDSLKIK